MCPSSYGWNVRASFIINLLYFLNEDTDRELLKHFTAGELFFLLLYFLLEEKKKFETKLFEAGFRG